MLWTMHDGLMWDATGVLDHHRRANELLGGGEHIDLTVPPAVAAGHDWLGSVDSAIANHLPLVAAQAHLWLGQSDRARTAIHGPSHQTDFGDTVAYLAVRATIADRPPAVPVHRRPVLIHNPVAGLALSPAHRNTLNIPALDPMVCGWSGTADCWGRANLATLAPVPRPAFRTASPSLMSGSGPLPPRAAEHRSHQELCRPEGARLLSGW